MWRRESRHRVGSMKTIEYRTMDKSSWGHGDWEDEPDKRQWLDVATGLPCLIVRNQMGALCGYVGVSPGHQCHGKPYHEVDVQVHGGLTFADRCNPGEDVALGICHLTELGDADPVWWLGFDCSHSGDLTPTFNHDMRGVVFYRNIKYVTRQCEQLAKQLMEHERQR